MDDAFEFQFDEAFKADTEVKLAFEKYGFVLIRGLLDTEELNKLKTALESDEGIFKHKYGRNDGAGRKSKVALWNQPGNDITGVIARTEKMAGTFEQLLGGEVYHYHSKVIMKEAHTGGQHVWHQDYGYWYENGCMFPDMGTVWLAVDRADQSNGCLQILKGSHRLGRIDHGKVGEQAGADVKRVELAKQFCPLMHVICDPGDALFFHSNLLHRSDQNSSNNRRWAFLVAYNKADNNPVFKHHHPQYIKLDKVPNSAIKDCATTTDMTGKDFFHGPVEDFSLDKIIDKEPEKH